jgi:hypothetical protein
LTDGGLRPRDVMIGLTRRGVGAAVCILALMAGRRLGGAVGGAGAGGYEHGWEGC